MTEDEQILSFMKLIGYAILVLVAGMILWRLSVAFSRKKRKPQGGNYFRSKFKDHWEK